MIADDIKSEAHFRLFLDSVPASSRAVLLFTTQATDLLQAACAAAGVAPEEQQAVLLGDLPRGDLLRMLGDVAGPQVRGTLAGETLARLAEAVGHAPLAVQCAPLPPPPPVNT